ncbi:SIMPL domain-containing protein [Neobacillus sp. FSL H8-0543]|uniref:SIMPL domain-containing protein n=1 Tax=Neobacillus sp. FSL H8-0543 TaxID=2954672 RepID=UPI003158787B
MIVTGEGQIAVQPDTASVNLGVITEDKELIPAQQQNSITGTQLINALVSIGIEKNNIKTFDYRIESDYDYDQGKQIFRGYKVTHILQVNIDDLSTVGNVVDTAVQNGANYIANVQFTAKSKESYYNQALSMALKNAGEKAKTIANTINVSLFVTPVLVTEGGGTVQPFESQQTFVKGVSSTQLEPGQLVIKATVSAEYKYSPNY